MTDDERAALIAAETWFYLERNCPGASLTTVWRVPHHRLKAMAARQAKDLPAHAGHADRKAWIIALDDKGDPDIKSINMNKDLKAMSADERLDEANKRAGDGKKRALTPQQLLDLARKRKRDEDRDND